MTAITMPKNPPKKKPAIDQAVRFDLIKRHLPDPPANVFEVGFGAGALIRWLAEQGYRVSGCEVSEEDVRKLTDAPGIDRVLHANGNRLPVDDESQDCVLSSDVFEHVLPEHRDGFLAEKMRVVRPGGTVVMTVWLHDTLSFRAYGVVQLLFARMLPQWFIEHLQIPHPKLEDIEQVFRSNLEDVHVVKYQGTVNLMCMSLQHLAFHRWKFNVVRKLGFLEPVARRCDFFGRKTSALLVGRKPSENGRAASSSSNHDPELETENGGL